MNVACDLAINPPLLHGGFDLPSCRLMPGERTVGPPMRSVARELEESFPARD